MQKYWGLRGSRITIAALVLIVGPAYTCFGYNQGVAGNVLTLPTFIETFPSLDTVTTTGKQEQHNSTVQGIVLAQIRSIHADAVQQELSSHCLCSVQPLVPLLV